MNNNMITQSEIQLIEPDYEGIAKVLSEFEKLYKVCSNQLLLDRCLETFLSPRMLVNKK
tara:strand:- start:590 stop:766 length:177 start_codon:yes stop_codon:yes gene_type:complete